MTTELAKLLTDISELIKDWNSRAIPTEEEFIQKLRSVNDDIYEELKKPQMVQKTI